jgi:hypothetical protein
MGERGGRGAGGCAGASPAANLAKYEGITSALSGSFGVVFTDLGHLCMAVSSRFVNCNSPGLVGALPNSI